MVRPRAVAEWAQPMGPSKSTSLRAGQMGLEAGRDLLLDGLPSRVADRGEVPVEVVHDSRPFRLPMPSDPDPASSVRRPARRLRSRSR